MRIISRAEWGARPPKRPLTTVPWPWRVGVAVHYTFGNRDDTPRELQAYAQDTLNYADMHYNLLVDWRGNAYEGRGWAVSAAHSEGENTQWVGIAFIGRDGDVTPDAETTIAALVAEAHRLAGRPLKLAGHQELPDAQTSCPGPRLMGLVIRLRQGGNDMALTDVVKLPADQFPELLGQRTIPLGDLLGWTAARVVRAELQMATLVATVTAIAARVAISPDELAQIEAAARAGAEAGVIGAVDELVAAFVAALPDDVASRDDVVSAIREVLNKGVAGV